MRPVMHTRSHVRDEACIEEENLMTYNLCETALTPDQLRRLAEAAKAGIARRGVDFFAWKNAPEYASGKFTHSAGWGDSATTLEVSAQEALAIGKEKLDGAYGERFALSVALAIGLAGRGVPVHLLQLQKEVGTPFDATGWLVLAVDGHPLFHLSPDDLPLADVADIVRLVEPDSEEAQAFAWKGTNKVGELSKLIDLMID